MYRWGTLILNTECSIYLSIESRTCWPLLHFKFKSLCPSFCGAVIRHVNPTFARRGIWVCVLAARPSPPISGAFDVSEGGIIEMMICSLKKKLRQSCVSSDIEKVIWNVLLSYLRISSEAVRCPICLRDSDNFPEDFDPIEMIVHNAHNSSTLRRHIFQSCALLFLKAPGGEAAGMWLSVSARSRSI